MLGLYIRLLSISAAARLLRLQPGTGLRLFEAQEKYYFHLSHENNDTKGEVARGWAK